MLLHSFTDQIDGAGALDQGGRKLRMPSLIRLATALTDTLLESVGGAVGGASISSGAEAVEEHDTLSTLSMHGQRGAAPAVALA